MPIDDWDPVDYFYGPDAKKFSKFSISSDYLSPEELENIKNAKRILDVYGVKSECGFVSVVEVAELIRKLA